MGNLGKILSTRITTQSLKAYLYTEPCLTCRELTLGGDGGQSNGLAGTHSDWTFARFQKAL